MHVRRTSVLNEKSSAYVKRRKRSARLSQPLNLDYAMRHDVDQVTTQFQEYLRADAVTFEVCLCLGGG